MLIDFKNKIATVQCNNCKTEIEHNLSNWKSEYREEFDEYENLMLTCMDCGRVEGFNMNLPLEEDVNEMPENEIIQRELVKEMIKNLREDFMKNKK